jgi:LytS/YehU family sensor histidine kinase
MFFGLTLIMIRNWYEQKEQNALITQENLKAKLQLLKQHLQPHFFFNTLNSLYSLSLQKSDQTPVMILKLSGLMRYLSDNQSSDWVTLKEEISFLQDYLAIEEIRYQDKVQITLTISIENPDGVYVPHLVLSTFIENAFKHGVANSLTTAFITIDIHEDEKDVYYKVINSKGNFRNNNTATGLRNLRARLEIMYGKNFNMILSNTDKTYRAELLLKKQIENV